MRWPLACVLACLSLGCGDEPERRPESGVSPPPSNTEVPRDTGVWGVADLHAHPAAHLSFAGEGDGTGGVIWGHPGIHRSRDGVVPAQRSCDAETHLDSSLDQVQRATRSLVFTVFAGVATHPHSPYGGDEFGSRETDGPRQPYNSWPHSRDILHQQMQIEVVRRAYEGGLRLMVASVTDNRTISTLFRAPIFPGVPQSSLEDDYASAVAQLEFLHEQVAQNSDWMEIVTSPFQAEDAILAGRLAIILSLEMDALTIDQVEQLFTTYGVRQIIPIHLADNHVGGTALFNEVFNAHSALQSSLLGAEQPRYVAVERADHLLYRSLWLPRIAVGIANFEPSQLAIGDYGPLGYEELPLCGHAGLPWGTGQRNSVGLLDAEYLRRLVELGMLIDVSHMGERALMTTLRTLSGEALCGAADAHAYPVMASHSGIFPDDERRESERDLSVSQARAIVATGGIVGLGTQGEAGVVAPDGSLGPPITWFHATGGPLHVFTPDQRTVAIVKTREGPSEACDIAVGGATEERLDLRDNTLSLPAAPATPGSLTIPYVRVEPCDPPPECAARTTARVVEMGCGPTGTTCTVDFGDGRFSAPDLANVRTLTVGWMTPSVCRTIDSDATWRIPVGEVRLNDERLGPTAVSTDAACAPERSTWFELSMGRASFVVARGSCETHDEPRPAPPASCRADAGAPTDAGMPDAGVDAGMDDPDAGGCDRSSERTATGRPPIARITLRTTGTSGVLRGTSTAYRGTDVCVRLQRRDASGTLVPMPLDAEAGDYASGACEQGWIAMNRGAAWGPGVTIRQHVILTDPVASVAGVEVSVRAYDARWANNWELAEVLVEEVGDPLQNWSLRYDELLHEVFDADEPVPAFAMGTDFNGLVPQFAISQRNPRDDEEDYCVELRGGPTPDRISVRRQPPLLFAGPDGELTEVLFTERGMAGFGMMPDAFELLYDYGRDETLSGLFRSAQRTIDMWRLADRWHLGEGCGR